MVILSARFSSPVKYGVMNAGRPSIFHHRYTHTHVPNTKASFYAKLFEENRFMKEPVAGWTERYIVIDDEPDQILANFSEKVRPHQIDNPPLSFENYKRDYLKPFGEYRAEYEKYYSDEIIRESYEDYCQGSYNSYLIEREQINPGIIL